MLLPGIVLRISYNLLHVTSTIKLLKRDDDRLIGHPLHPSHFRLAMLVTEVANESLYDADVINDYIGDQQVKKNSSPLNQRDEEEEYFGKSTPGPSRGWNRHPACNIISIRVCTRCNLVIRIYSPFHGVERWESVFKLLEVYPPKIHMSRQN